MASTASPLRTVPGTSPAEPAGHVARTPPRAVPGVAPRTGTRAPARGSAARGNHPAGRALPHPAVEPAGEGLAPVLPLRRAGAVVVPLRPVASRSAEAAEAVQVAEVHRAPRVGELRLTRRGRTVLGGLGVVAALGVAAVVGPVLGGGADPALELAGRSSVVVHSGDTLWSIAETVAPDADPRGVVDALRELNGLTDPGLVPGQVLVLP